jgi:hypothetical protein
MGTPSPLARIAVGVVVELRRIESRWIDHAWRATGVLPGVPDAVPWTRLSDDGQTAAFYAGSADIELYHSDAEHYRDNLASGAPLLWIVLRPTGVEPPYELFAVTANPAEGEAFAQAGTDLVECVPMPPIVRGAIEAFVAEHHVERPFFKRQRDRADPEALARRPPVEGAPVGGSENALSRWSRRKREAAEANKEVTALPTAPSPPRRVEGQASGEARPGEGAVEPPFDTGCLPPIASITAETDIRAFLAPGIPPELKHAALRQAWRADPKIRDFAGPADYDWDFNRPGVMAGFGSLDLTEELRNRVIQTIQAPAKAAEDSPQTAFSLQPEDTGGEAGHDHVNPSLLAGDARAHPPRAEAQDNRAQSCAERSEWRHEDNAPPQPIDKDRAFPPIARRKQGGALPK